MNKELYLDYSAFLRSIKANKDTTHSFLLGAGASISSGVQSASDYIWEWKRDIYLSQNSNSSNYYNNYKIDSVKASIQKWLDIQNTYPKKNDETEYSFYAEKAYPIPEDRRRYFQKLIKGIEPYIGYQLICLLHKYKLVSSVWTTNFDSLIVKAAHKLNLTPIEITLDSNDRILRNQNVNELLSIALHGDYKYDKLKNTETELNQQEELFSNYFKNYHIDKNLIVIGYSGRDNSLMKTLKQTYTQKGSGRLYWCCYGKNVDEKVIELIKFVRKNGREAFLITTEGFDTTILNICQNTITDSIELKKELDEIVSKYHNESKSISPFSIEEHKADKYIKSNLHPILFPKEIYQFEVDYKSAKPWKFLKELIGKSDICAIPFKNKVYALGISSQIKKVFNSHIIGDIERVSIEFNKIKNVSVFQSLMLQAVIQTFAKTEMIDTDNRTKIWDKRTETFEVIGKKRYKVYKSLKLSLQFGNPEKYAFISFQPTIYIESQEDLTKEIKQQISKRYLNKLYNYEYDETLNEWNKVLFLKEKYEFSFPLNSDTNFNFKISKKSAFAEIKLQDKANRVLNPKNYNSKYTQFLGIELLEPQLNFLNSNTGKTSYDFHPMRGLVKHKPIDNNLNGIVYNNQINLSIICESKYSDKFHVFLKGFNNKFSANVNPDYLINYEGFYHTYNINLNIPLQDDDNWISLEIKHNSDLQNMSLQIRDTICQNIKR